MFKFKFGTTSSQRLSNCHKDIITVMNEAIKVSDIDFGIACGYRSVKEQQDLYNQGRNRAGVIVTYVDGVKMKSKHNNLPSLAVDIYAYVDGKATWDEKYLYYLGGVIMLIAKQKNITLRWGGNWDRDATMDDQRFNDLPHFELL